MTRLTAAALTFCFALTAAKADDPPSPADQLAEIKKAVADAEAEYYKVAKTLPGTLEGVKKSEELWQRFDKFQSEAFAKAVDIAKANPKSEVGFAALEWVLSIPRSYYLPPGVPAMELMAEQYAADPKVGKVIALLGVSPPNEAAFPEAHATSFALIRAVLDGNSDRTARGLARLAIARQAMTKFAVAEYRKHSDVDALAANAERELETVADEYGDCKLPFEQAQQSLGDIARAELFELRHLRVGKAAPNIEGEDLDGITFDLNRYRGKVVLLVFWAGWCGPCMADVPHERELVEKYKNRPFVLVGVNGDDTMAEAKVVAENAKISWRSFWNGSSGPRGGIAFAWNIRSWPTTYVIDAAGTIRHKHLRGEQLDEPLEKLVAEAEAAKK